MTCDILQAITECKLAAADCWTAGALTSSGAQHALCAVYARCEVYAGSGALTSIQCGFRSVFTTTANRAVDLNGALDVACCVQSACDNQRSILWMLCAVKFTSLMLSGAFSFRSTGRLIFRLDSPSRFVVLMKHTCRQPTHPCCIQYNVHSNHCLTSGILVKMLCCRSSQRPALPCQDPSKPDDVYLLYWLGFAASR